MKRRDLLKIGAFSALAAAAGTGFLKIYKHQTGVKKVIEFPAPILRKISSPVNVIDDKIISNEYAALLTHEIDHLNGILFIDQHAGIDT
jgi:peptide deformylase